MSNYLENFNLEKEISTIKMYDRLKEDKEIKCQNIGCEKNSNFINYMDGKYYCWYHMFILNKHKEKN